MRSPKLNSKSWLIHSKLHVATAGQCAFLLCIGIGYDMTPTELQAGMWNLDTETNTQGEPIIAQLEYTSSATMCYPPESPSECTHGTVDDFSGWAISPNSKSGLQRPTPTPHRGSCLIPKSHNYSAGVFHCQILLKTKFINLHGLSPYALYEKKYTVHLNLTFMKPPKLLTSNDDRHFSSFPYTTFEVDLTGFWWLH